MAEYFPTPEENSETPAEGPPEPTPEMPPKPPISEGEEGIQEVPAELRAEVPPEAYETESAKSVSPGASETPEEIVSEMPPASGPESPPGGPSYYAPPEPLSPSDERTWAMLSHLSVLANLVTGVLGPVIALVIYLVFKDRSRYVAFQSMQAFIFQLVWWLGGGILAIIAWTISGLLAVILIGCLLMPLALLISLVPLGALVYGVIGAVETNQGRDFRYWLIGDWVQKSLMGTLQQI